MNDCSFQKILRQNLGWFLSWHWKTLFLRGFILKSTERGYLLLKDGTKDFQNSPLFARSTCFYVTISGNFERFQYFNFEIDFLENENIFQNENAFFWKCIISYKTTISEANVKTNRMVSAKWTYHEERSFSSNYFIFLRILFQFNNLLLRVDLMYQRPKCTHIRIFCQRWSFYWWCFFPVSILNLKT